MSGTDKELEFGLRQMAELNHRTHWTHAKSLVGEQVWTRARDTGLIRFILSEAVLSKAGRGAIKAIDYTAHDPSTWRKEDRNILYRRGYCHVLAMAMHDRTGLPVVMLRDRKVRARDRTPSVLHVFVEAPDGRCYDIDGLTSRQKIIADCAAHSPVFQISEDNAGIAPFIGEFSHLAVYDAEDLECATRVIDQIAEEHRLPELGFRTSRYGMLPADIRSWPPQMLAAITGWSIERLRPWLERPSATSPDRDWWQTAGKEDLEKEASIWRGMAGKYDDTGIPVEDADWRYDKIFSTEALVSLMAGDRDGWLRWFADECRFSVDDGRDGYANLLLEDIVEPIVLIDMGDGRVDIWDGWHRAAAAIVKGAPTLRAIVGTRCHTPLMESGHRVDTEKISI